MNTNYNYHLWNNEDIAAFVKEQDAWDDLGVPEAMLELTSRANSALWDQYKCGTADDKDGAMKAAEDILSWIGETKEENEDWDWDAKVWDAGEVLENLAKDPSPYKQSDIDNGIYNGWESIAVYIQKILGVDLGL